MDDDARSPVDGEPRGGILIEQEWTAVRYELLVRLKLPWGLRVLVIRCYEDGSKTCAERAA